MGIGSVRSRNGQVFRRKLCVGWDGPCFACDGRGELGVALEVSDTKIAATMPCVPGTKAGDRRGIGGGAHTPGRRMSVKDVVPEDWTEVLA
jgi:hypothetical protein